MAAIAFSFPSFSYSVHSDFTVTFEERLFSIIFLLFSFYFSFTRDGRFEGIFHFVLFRYFLSDFAVLNNNAMIDARKISGMYRFLVSIASFLSYFDKFIVALRNF